MKYCPMCAKLLVEREVEGRRRPVCSVCEFVFYQDPKVAVAVLVSNDGKLLLNKRAIDPGMGRWSFPAGYVDRGEQLEAAARREVKEELSVDVRLERLFGLYSETGNPVVLAVYLGRIEAGEPLAGPEVTEIGWFSPNELPEMAFPHDATIIEAWARTL